MDRIIATGAPAKVYRWLEDAPGFATVAQIKAGSGTGDTTVRTVIHELHEAGMLEANDDWPRGYRLVRHPARAGAERDN
jgi:hypothetical protein